MQNLTQASSPPGPVNMLGSIKLLKYFRIDSKYLFQTLEFLSPTEDTDLVQHTEVCLQHYSCSPISKHVIKIFYFPRLNILYRETKVYTTLAISRVNLISL